MLSTLSADGYLSITIALRPFILWVVSLTVFVLCTGFMIGHRFGPARVVFLPERVRGPRRYWLQPDGSITTEQSPDGAAERAIPLNAKVGNH